MRQIKFYVKEPSKVLGAFTYIWGKSVYAMPAVVANVVSDSWYVYPLVYGACFGCFVWDRLYNGKKLMQGFNRLNSWFKAPYLDRAESVKMSRLLRDALLNANLVTRDKVGKDQVVTIPDVEINKDDYNYYLICHMLPGQTTEQWQNKASIFSNAFGYNLVKYEVKNGLVKVVLQHTQVDAGGVTYKKDDDHTLDLGYWAGGNLKWEFDKDPHMLVVGMTGTGKSTFLRNLFVQFRRDWHVSVVDGKFVEFSMLKKFGFNVASDQDQFKQVIEDAWIEVDRRFRLLEESQKNHYSQLDLDPYFLVIDEFIYVVESYGSKKKDKDDLWARLKDIAVRGRAAGVSMVLILQRPDAEYLPTLVRDNIACKVVLGAASETAYEMAFGQEHKKLTRLSMGEGYGQIRDNLVNFSFVDYNLDKFLEDMQWASRSGTTRPTSGRSGSGTESA